MVKIKRTVTISHNLDDAIAMLATRNGESYSAYVESRLLMNDNIRKTVQELEKLPKFPKVDVQKIMREKRRLSAKRLTHI